VIIKYNWDDQVKEDEIGRTCRMNVRENERMYVIRGKARRKEAARKTKT
jgi:hypothetical protein